MKNVSQILNSKGHETWSIAKDATVFEALKLMAVKNVGALLVLEEEKLAGIFTERDYARKVFLLGKSSSDMQVAEVMTPKVLYVRPKQTVEDCMALMTHKHIRHLPVMDGDELIGVVSIGDIVKETISEKQFVIEQLESYITGGRWLK